MTETRTCPECGTEIPSQKRILCPKCNFDLRRMDDDKYIANRLKSSEGTSQGISSTDASNRRMAGLSIIAGIFILLWWLTSWFMIDSMSGLMCFVIFLPGVVGIILVVIGIRNISKSEETKEQTQDNGEAADS